MHESFEGGVSQFYEKRETFNMKSLYERMENCLCGEWC